MNSFLIGTFAAILTTSALLPQAIKAHQTRHTKDVSLLMFMMTSTGVALWIVYGLMINAVPVIASNTATLFLCLYILFLKIKYG